MALRRSRWSKREEIRPRIAGRIIVAHYAVFDTRVLRSLLKTYQLKTPDVSYACTVEISRTVTAQKA